MIYTLQTKRGLGIELWGSYEDLDSFYDTVGKFWNDDNLRHLKGYDNRDKVISGFSYEIRKAFEGSRKKRKHSHYSLDEISYYGTTFSWVHVLFSLAALRYNMRYTTANERDLFLFRHLESQLENAMFDFDEHGAKDLVPFLNGAIYAGMEFLYQFMRLIHADYLRLGGGKRAFRILPLLMEEATFRKYENSDRLLMLQREALGLGCEIGDLEIEDNDIDYDHLIW